MGPRKAKFSGARLCADLWDSGNQECESDCGTSRSLELPYHRDVRFDSKRLSEGLLERVVARHSLVTGIGVYLHG